MNRVTSYKCIYDANNERFKFAMTLAGEGGKADFIVSNPDAAETLLDMFEDSTEAHFEEASGELTFAFDALAVEDDEEDVSDAEDSEAEDEASRSAA
jgi:hypothetical protein